jgi:hypothetical protein
VWDENVGPHTEVFQNDQLGVLRFPYHLVYDGVADWEANGPLADAYEVNVRRLVTRIFFNVFYRIVSPLVV